MFKSARIKLTAYYLIILITITLAFSGVIFRVIGTEIDRFAAAQRFRLELRFGAVPPQFRDIDIEVVTEAKKHLIMMLITVNGIILIVAGALSYFLAGQTLQPIQNMLDDQNRFISDASHELRTPLTSLKSAMEVSLRDPKLTLKDAKLLITDNIADVDKLKSLSDQLLQLTQYQKPNGHNKFEKTNLALLITKTIQTLKPLAKQKKITIISKLAKISLVVNPYSLNDLITILIDNAIKYSPPDSRVEVTAKKDKNSVLITVKDDGIGIAAKDIPHIFDRFYRADAARSQQPNGGYGLGLSIAKRIVDIHHGSINVVSQPGRGSTFIVQLPFSISHYHPRSWTRSLIGLNN